MSGFALIYLIFIVGLLVYLGYQAYFWLVRRQVAKVLSKEEFQETMHQAQIVDVRESQEFRSAHIYGARNVPYSSVRQTGQVPGFNRSQPIYLYDNGVNIATRMAQRLKKQNYDKVYILRGGFAQWEGKTKRVDD